MKHPKQFMMTVSGRLNRLIETPGKNIIKMFIDCILFDSCTNEDVNNFIEAFKEQLDKVKEDV